jgi:hypothetical protein
MKFFVGHWLTMLKAATVVTLTVKMLPEQVTVEILYAFSKVTWGYSI